MSQTPTRRRPLRALTGWLTWLGGADRDVLQKVPSARDRFVQMALVLLTTAGLAVVSMTFALTDGVSVPLELAIVFGLLWGFVILNLDRFLVLSMGSVRGARQLLLMALPRVLMAIVLAAVISTPLVLRVFQSDIRFELHMHQLSNSQVQAQQSESTKEKQDADAVKQQIGDYERILAGHLPTSVSSPALESAVAKVEDADKSARDAEKARDKAYEAWQCELYGAGSKCHDASKKKGAGPLAQAKHRQYLAADARSQRAQTRLKDAERERTAEEGRVKTTQAAELARKRKEANERLPELRQRSAELTAVLEGRADQGTRLNAADTGLLAQLRALSAIGERDRALQWAHLLVGALFFLIEILPVVVKILMNLGSPSAYDLASQLKEEELKDLAKIHRTEARHIAERKSQTRINLEEHMREQEERIGKQANDHVAGEMETIVDAALTKWSQEVQDQLTNGPAANGNGNGNGHAHTSTGRARSWRFGGGRKRGHADPADPYAMPAADEL